MTHCGLIRKDGPGAPDPRMENMHAVPVRRPPGLAREDQCERCAGFGWLDCAVCQGTGRLFLRGPMDRAFDDECDACSGAGTVPCTLCRGAA